MSKAQIAPDPAASVILLRQYRELEVLMVRRHSRGFFGGLVVFPGGGVDDVDRSELARSVVKGDHPDHEHRAAALRELAEETGLLATGGEMARAPDLRGEDLLRALADHQITLDGDALVFISRWITPEMAPRRFDARFYILDGGTTPPVRLDTDELVDHAWISPELALLRHQEGEWPMFLPTLAHLRWLARRSSLNDAIESARGADGRTLVEPTRMNDGSLVPVLLPAEGP